MKKIAHWKMTAALGLALALILSGCPTDTPEPTVTGVTVSPNPASVERGETQPFDATVLGSNNPPQAVTWTVEGGQHAETAIDRDSGLLSVSPYEATETLTVRATSTFNTAVYGTATANLTGGAGAAADIAWTAAANDAANTTAIDFSFASAITGLAVGDITLAPGTGAATPGELVGSGMSWSLTVTVTSPGTVYASIDRAGIAPEPQQVEVFQGGTAIPAEIVGRWHLEPIGFMYEFTDEGWFIPATGYSGQRVSVSGNTLSVSMGGDTVGTANFELAANLMTLSNVAGAAGFAPGPHVRHDITFTATVNCEVFTTAIYLEFSHPVWGLSPAHVTVINQTGTVMRGALTGEGRSWSLEVAVVTAGNVIVSIDRPGIEGGVKPVAVDNSVDWTAAANEGPNTTFIDFEFTFPVHELTGDDITVAAGTSTVTTGALTGGGTSWSLAVTVTSLGDGDVSVSIDMPGVVGGPRVVEVFREPISWAATASGRRSTDTLNFEFDEPVPELVADDIIVTGAGGAVEPGALTGGGTSWSLAVVTTSSGDVDIRIERHGVEGGPVTVTVNVVRYVSAGGSHTVEIRGDGTLWAWGNNWNSPVQIGAATDWLAVSAGGSHTVAIREDGTLWDWAWGDDGPVQIGTDTGWLAVSVGYGHTVAIREDGSLWAWGNNWNGQLGDGTTTSRHSPVRIGADTSWRAVSAGYGHTVAIRGDGSLWAWGRKYRWGLYHPLLVQNHGPSPVRIGTDTNWAAVSAGSVHVIAIREDGSLWAWGFNENGRLGDGTSATRLSPVRIGTDMDWRTVSAGGGHTMAIRGDGSLWAWGDNRNGQLGDGTSGGWMNNRFSPVQIGTDMDWATVSAGGIFTSQTENPRGGHTMAVREEGSLWAWGDNWNGQLGDGTTTGSDSPIQVIP